MTPFWMAVISLLSSVLLLLLTACVPPNPRADATADAYLASPRSIPSPRPVIQHILNRVGGDIVIVAGLTGHVDTDVVATGKGIVPEAARIDVSRRLTVTNDLSNLEVRLTEESSGIRPLPEVRALLHVLVPPETDLPDINTHAGSIEVYGNVGNITATIAFTGDIKVRGANGDVKLTTEKGSITADILPGHDITATARAVESNIDIRAEEASVSAATEGGNIRFYGTLRPKKTHQFIITKTGDIHIAVPAYPAVYTTTQVIYRFHVATSANPVEIEYPALGAITGTSSTALPICGFIYGGGPWDYHVENTQAPLGRIEISPVITSTYFLTGTLATDYFRFDTNQTRVSFFTPITQSIHIYTAAQLNQIIAGKETIAPECRAALSANLTDAIILKLATGRGLVYIHHRLMLTN